MIAIEKDDSFSFTPIKIVTRQLAKLSTIGMKR